MIWSTGVPSAGSACCTPPMPAPGSPWPKRCSASLSDGRWKAITSTTWKCSKSGSPTPSPGGIAIPLRSSGEASAMPGGTAPRRDATGLAGRGPPPTMWFHVASVRSAFTGGSATAAEMASDPLEPFPMAFGDHFDCSVANDDGGLIVHQVRRHRHADGPFFSIGHGIVRHVLVIQVRKQRKIKQSQRAIATGGRLPADEVLPDAGSHHHAPGAQSYIDRLAPKLWQEVSQSGLPHPVAQIQGIAAFHQQGVRLLDQREP